MKLSKRILGEMHEAQQEIEASQEDGVNHVREASHAGEHGVAGMGYKKFEFSKYLIRFPNRAKFLKP